jgi:DNA-binding NarL/FixJ family response regulator
MRVLIADDSTLVRDRLATLICELQGVELVGQTGNAPETLTAIRRLKPDVVILDIRMPGGNGIHILEKIKAHDASPIVIMLTAFPYPQYSKKCLEAGAEYFFDKATEFDSVAEVLEQLNGSRQVSHQPRARVETRGRANRCKDDYHPTKLRRARNHPRRGEGHH